MSDPFAALPVSRELRALIAAMAAAEAEAIRLEDHTHYVDPADLKQLDAAVDEAMMAWTSRVFDDAEAIVVNGFAGALIAQMERHRAYRGSRAEARADAIYQTRMEAL